MASSNTAIAENLKKRAADYTAARGRVSRRIVVCAGTGCIANGSLKVYEALKKIAEEKKLDVTVKLDPCDHGKKDVLLTHSGCQGFCQVGPLVTIDPDGILYTHVKPEDVTEIVEQTLLGGTIIDRLLYTDPSNGQH